MTRWIIGLLLLLAPWPGDEEQFSIPKRGSSGLLLERIPTSETTSRFSSDSLAGKKPNLKTLHRRSLSPVAGSTELALNWLWAPAGQSIGVSGMYLEDLDGDGRLELVAAAIQQKSFLEPLPSDPLLYYWYVLAWDGNDYRPIWMSPPLAEPINAMAVAQIDSDPAMEVLVGSNNTVSIYDGATHELQGSISLDTFKILDLAAGDIDADGTIEIVVSDIGALNSYSASSGIQELAIPDVYGVSISLGQIDDDPALEIGLTEGYGAAYAFDGASGAVDWEHGNGLGYIIRLGDLNNDGYDEAVGAFYQSTGIEAWDVAANSLLWSVPASRADALSLVDVDGDSGLEVLFGDTQESKIRVLNQNGAELWHIDDPGPGATDIVTGDSDGDGVREVLWGGGYASPGPDALFVVDTATQQLEWASLDVNGPFMGLDRGDVDADGNDEYLVTSFKVNNSRGFGRYLLFDIATRQLEYVSTIVSDDAGLWGGQLIDLDDDPQLEICIATGLFTGEIACFDGLTHAEEWRFVLPLNVSFGSLLAADVDGDGSLELLAGTRPEIDLLTSVYALDPATGLLRWRSPHLAPGGELTMLDVGDVDGDLELEVVVAASDGFVAVLDGATGLIELPPTAYHVTALEVSDVDGSGIEEEIIVGTNTGLIQLIDPSTGAVTTLSGPLGAPVDAIGRGVFGEEELYVISVAGDLGFYPSLTASPQSVFALGSRTGYHDSLLVTSVAGNTSVLVNNRIGVVELGALSPLIFEDGFELGNTLSWSSTTP